MTGQPDDIHVLTPADLPALERMEVELFEERRWEDAGVGMALIRDGNGTRSFETLLRYRSAAMAEFWRALKTLKALQAEHAADVLEQAAMENPVNLHGRADDLIRSRVMQLVDRHVAERSRSDPPAVCEKSRAN